MKHYLLLPGLFFISGIWLSNLFAQNNVTDADGNIYTTVVIGNQVWMSENLKTIKYNDRTDIPQITDNKAWESLTSPGFCWYYNDGTTYKNTYGALYNWYSVKTGKLCPSGWHVPGQADWKVLSDYAGGSILAGGKVKETGTIHWKSPNFSASNKTGFTALPGGLRYLDGTFRDIGENGYWWSSDEYDDLSAWYRIAFYSFTDLSMSNHLKKVGTSVRCLKD